MRVEEAMNTKCCGFVGGNNRAHSHQSLGGSRGIDGAAMDPVGLMMNAERNYWLFINYVMDRLVIQSVGNINK